MSNGNEQGIPSWFTDIINVAGGYYAGDSAAKAAAEAGVKSAQEATELGETAAGMAKFQPFTVTTGLGTATTTPKGGYTLSMTPEQQALQTQLMGQAQGLFGQVGVDPSTAQADLYEQMRAVQRPEEERQRLALEERMLSQGRLGLQSAAYGGSSPELLAQETARQEAMARANLTARQQAMGEQAQALSSASGLMGLGYMPQQQALSALGMGIESGKLADVGRRTGAELFGQLGGRGLEALMQGVQLSTGLEELTRQQLIQDIIGSVSGGSGSSGSGMFGIDIDAELGDLVPNWLYDLADYFTPTDYGTPTVTVEEVIPE
jgi:hypothetical protein